MAIKFLCLNLYDGGLLWENIIDFLEKEKPDILALQEVNHTQRSKLAHNHQTLANLAKFYPKYFYHFAPEFVYSQDNHPIEIGNAIFSRFPIIDSAVRFFGIPYGEFPRDPADYDYSKHPKNMQICQLDINQQIYTLANLHGIWGLDGGDNPARLAMSQIIVEEIKSKPKVILAGDFNLKPNTQTIANIEQHLVNVFKDELDNTFNLARKDLVNYPGYATAVVDMVFTSSDIQIINHICPQVDVSDHLPLIMEFET